MKPSLKGGQGSSKAVVPWSNKAIFENKDYTLRKQGQTNCILSGDLKYNKNNYLYYLIFKCYSTFLGIG